jgi:hypothetical protein
MVVFCTGYDDFLAYVLCLLSSFLLLCVIQKKIKLLYEHKFPTNRFVRNFLQSTYKIDM